MRIWWCENHKCEARVFDPVRMPSRICTLVFLRERGTSCQVVEMELVPKGTRFDVNKVKDRRHLVVDMWAHGQPMQEIAERLDIPVSTVSRDIRLWHKGPKK